MNGYMLNETAYKKYLEEHPEEPEEVKRDIRRKIEALDIVARLDDVTRQELFNTGAFNNIAMGYMQKALDDIEADTDTKQQALNHINRLFDDMTSEQAEAYYMNN